MRFEDLSSRGVEPQVVVATVYSTNEATICFDDHPPRLSPRDPSRSEGIRDEFLIKLFCADATPDGEVTYVMTIEDFFTCRRNQLIGAASLRFDTTVLEMPVC